MKVITDHIIKLNVNGHIIEEINLLLMKKIKPASYVHEIISQY